MSFEEQIMSKDKYLYTYILEVEDYCVYYPSNNFSQPDLFIYRESWPSG